LADPPPPVGTGEVGDNPLLVRWNSQADTMAMATATMGNEIEWFLKNMI
jgi:hypothetical protein